MDFRSIFIRFQAHSRRKHEPTQIRSNIISYINMKLISVTSTDPDRGAIKLIVASWNGIKSEYIHGCSNIINQLKFGLIRSILSE